MAPKEDQHERIWKVFVEETDFFNGNAKDTFFSKKGTKISEMLKKPMKNSDCSKSTSSVVNDTILIKIFPESLPHEARFESS